MTVEITRGGHNGWDCNGCGVRAFVEEEDMPTLYVGNGGSCAAIRLCPSCLARLAAEAAIATKEFVPDPAIRRCPACGVQVPSDRYTDGRMHFSVCALQGKDVLQ
jgi:hypothetical protein